MRRFDAVSVSPCMDTGAADAAAGKPGYHGSLGGSAIA